MKNSQTYRQTALLGISCLLTACATVPTMNAPLSAATANTMPAAAERKASESLDNDALIVLTFSGGGMRAASFSYGVLKGLQATAITPQKSLLDEVDMISAVSGGSFTAAYYGLFGERIFRDYEADFLKHADGNHTISRWFLSLRNFGKMASPQFNRSDLFAEYYDDEFFAGKTFADMRDAPQIIINTTDISTGQAFAFTEENMRWICSDLASYPVSRAVAASAAVPAVFSPIVLKNHGGCDTDRDPNNAFTDRARYPNLHLVDGGVSGNLGVRGALASEVLQRLKQQAQANGVRQVIFIVVDAGDEIPTSIPDNTGAPLLNDTLNAVATIQSKLYNAETMAALQTQIEDWQQQDETCQRNNACQTMHYQVVHLDFDDLPNELANALGQIKTALTLDETLIDKLITAGEYLLIHNDKLQAVIPSPAQLQ